MWKRAQYRRPGRNGSDASASIGAGTRGDGRAAVVVDEYDGLTLLRSSPDAPPKPDGVAELARFLGGDKANDVFTVVVGADGATAELWARLGTVLDSAREQGATAVRLALSGAGRPRQDRPALAQRIADAWGIEVIAPDAGVVIVPGGSMFAIGAGAPVRGWRSFTPGAEPLPLGRRSPEPHWQSALARLPAGTVGGCVVEQVPAGILVRSAQAPRSRAANLCYAVPVDDDHLTILVGATEGDGGAGIPAEDLAALLAALPETIRTAARLAPCGPTDLLAVGQDTAEILGAEVEVLTGLPLVVGTDDEPVVRPVLIDADAEPTWVPFVEAVVCRPYGADGTDRVPAPQLVRWRSPVAGADHPEPGAIALSDRWQVSVTRAGLAVGPRGEAPAFAGRPVSPEQLAIEVNLRGAAADDALFADLSRLLAELGSGVRGFVTLHRVLPAHASGEEDFRLLRLAIEHGVSLVEPQPAEAPPASSAPTVRTVAIPRTGRPQSATAESSARPAAARADEPAVSQTAGPASRPWPGEAPVSPAARTGEPAAAPPGSAQWSWSGEVPASPAPRTGEPAGSQPGPGSRPYPGAPAFPASGAGEPAGSQPAGPGSRPWSGEVPASSASAADEPAGSQPGAGSRPYPGGAPASSASGADEPAAAQPAGPAPRPFPAEPPAAPGTPPDRTHEAGPSAPPRGRDDAEPLPPGLGKTPPTPVSGRPPEPSPSLSTAAEHALRPSSPSAAPAEPAGPATPAHAASSAAPAAGPDPAGPPPAPPATPPAPARPEPVAASPARPRTRPVAPARRSSEKERAEFRSLAQPVWERHSATVNRAMTRMPALRGPQMDATRTDLVAVHLYLSDSHSELTPPGEKTPDDADLPGCYTACLASGLCRLPSYRGVAVRGGLPADGALGRFVPGSVLREPGSVSALPLAAAAGLSAAAGGFVIWSSTGRRVRPLLGSVPGLAADEVVFPPGTGLRVLDVRSAGPAPIILLSEVLGAAADDRSGDLDDADRATLERLDEALNRQVPSSGGTSPTAWPTRCAKPLGG
ncbi:hypothetical protein [Actinomadura sp. DC4]|uniref:hypothetical protein n=1 Tax=Actinomadura sp. DC4 TaxID=3055069 RepID=UPI0025AF653E|nr:hypothetical protein [Actinomadura sp. DC4]MDN3354819.1 hypothetical protein [Actinomadura sp. DC4]